MYVEEPLIALSSADRAGRCRWVSIQTANPVRVVPDACMDVIWNGQELFIAGPDTRPVAYDAPVGTCTVGVRFAPGHAARVLDMPVVALVDRRIALTDCWGDDARRLYDQLAALHDTHNLDPRRALELLENAVAQRFARASSADGLIDALVQQFEHSAAEPAPVAKLARHFGLSERQLLRRCQARLGYGPKFLARVLRFQRFVALVRAVPTATRSLAELAHTAGYADQAHLGHEVAELAGTTPGQLRAEAHVSDSDKTPRPSEVHARAHGKLQRTTNPARGAVPVAERARP